MPINRKDLVDRHRVRLHAPDAQSPLSVGNGEFAFTADITGLQTFPEFHAKGLEDAGFGQQAPADGSVPGMQLGTLAHFHYRTLLWRKSSITGAYGHDTPGFLATRNRPARRRHRAGASGCRGPLRCWWHVPAIRR